MMQAQFLAIAVVGDADDLLPRTLGWRYRNSSISRGIDVLAAADQHVLAAPDDAAIALGVDGGQVAGMHPALGIDGLGGLCGSFQ